ncbi:MAG: magnesium/cobalt transporter CorA [Verrucomicrobiae bacterium]|jgi:magnesium transporter|nr:magnesium/cobalt transporter CorA [Verrucomicrobiae bacterium]
MIRSFAYTNQGALHEQDIEPFVMPTVLADTSLFLWVDLEDPTPEESRLVLENIFHFHPLSIEDATKETLAPKVEEYEPKEDDSFAPYLFVAIHAVDYSRKDGVFATSELNFFLGKNFLVTVHDLAMKAVTVTAELSRRPKSKVFRSPDRVAYTLLDSLVDHYKPALDELSLELARLETEVIEDPSQSTMHKILGIKREVLHLRQIIGPQREVLHRFALGHFGLIRPKMLPYFRDVYDSLFRISDMAQGYADSLTGILHVYLSMVSNQTGDVVKLLTLITVITTPMMVLGTWYGMNFRNMPELALPNGYGTIALIAASSTVVTYWYFKRKRWL